VLTFAIITIAGISVYALLKPPAAPQEDFAAAKETLPDLERIGQGMPGYARIHGTSNDL